MTTRIHRDGPIFPAVAPNARPAASQPTTRFQSILSASTGAVLHRNESAGARLPVVASSAAPVVLEPPGAGTPVVSTPANTSPIDPAEQRNVPPISSIEAALTRRSQEVMLYLEMQNERRDTTSSDTTPSNTNETPHDTVENHNRNRRASHVAQRAID